MSRPRWHEAESREKVAMAVQTGPDGHTRVVAAGAGVEADKLVARARAAGVEVRQDTAQMEQMLRAEGEGSTVPPEVYELMATVVNFAQELNEQWLNEQDLDEEEV